MITSVFKKSTPINYTLLVIFVLFSFLLYRFHSATSLNSLTEWSKMSGMLVLVFATLFISNFIAKKNGLTRNSGYVILFFFLLTLFSPSIYNNYNIVLSNFFILLAMRRLVSLQTLKAPKEKIFDASLWIFVASLFHFWAINYILLVYISIIFHVSRDYRNWLLPFVALFAISILFAFYSVLYDSSAINHYLSQATIDLKLDYFSNNYQNIALSIFVTFSVYFVFSSIFSIPNKPLNLQASYKKIIFGFLIGISIYVLSTNKSNDLLLFTFLPLSIMATNSIEYSNNRIMQEVILALFIIAGVFCYVTQL